MGWDGMGWDDVILDGFRFFVCIHFEGFSCKSIVCKSYIASAHISCFYHFLPLSLIIMQYI
jgi:hypothetical protein